VGALKFNPSFNGGGRIVYSASPNLGIGLDGVFRTEGFKSEITNGKTIHRLHYINLDPKLYYFFGKRGQGFRPKIGIGPNFGFLVGGKTKVESPSFPVNIKSKEIYKGANLGIAGTLGLNYRIKSGTWLNVDAVYNHGISDLTKGGGDPQSRSLFLNVGATFGIGNYKKK
jgi:outer membrane protein W